MRTVIGRVHHDGVPGNAQLVQQIEHLTHLLVVFDHDVMIFRLPAPGLAQNVLGRVHAEVHPGGVQPHKERLIVGMRALDEVLRCVHKLGVTRLHAFPSERAGVLNLLFAHAAPARLLSGVVLLRRPGVQHASRAEELPKVGVLLLGRVIDMPGSSSALRWYRLPKNSSNHARWARCLFISPKWFLPNWPVV